MSVALVIAIGGLAAAGAFLIMNRSLTRIVLGVGLLANAVNLLILVAGGPAGEPPILGSDGRGDPLPQAFVLTAIVIGLAITSFLLALAWRSWTIDGNDEVEDDLEDRLIARRRASATRASELRAAQEAAAMHDDSVEQTKGTR